MKDKYISGKHLLKKTKYQKMKQIISLSRIQIHIFEGRIRIRDIPKEGVMLHTALPQVFAGLPGRGLEPVRTLLVLNRF